MKKYVVSFIAALIISVMPVSAFALAESAAGACIMNGVTGEVIFENNADALLPMASTTKIMTLIVALLNSSPDDIVTVAEEATKEEGSSAYIEAGAQITMRDLCYGLMLNSGNDAAVAIAYHIAGGKKEFAEMMTEKAREIGAVNTSFKNPNGLDEEGHYTTARDLAIITRYALKNELFRDIVSKRTYDASYIRPDGSVTELMYINHNRLLSEMEGCIGVKTGYTKTDGRCLVSACDRDGKIYIAVTLNDENDWAEHKAMMDAAYSDSRWVTAVKAGDCVRHIVSNGGECELISKTDFYVPVNGSANRDIEVLVNAPREIYTSLNAGEKVGELEIYYGDELIGKTDVVAKDDFYRTEEKAKVKNCFWFFAATLLRKIFV